MTVTKYILPTNGDFEVIEVTGRGMELEGKFSIKGQEIDPTEHQTLSKIIQIGVLCNNSNIQNNGPMKKLSTVGDPMEIALLVVAEKANLPKNEIIEHFPEAKEVSFDPSVMMMATYNELDDGRYMVAIKGSPDEVLKRCTNYNNGELDDLIREEWMNKNNELASQGNRVLAMATKVVSNIYDAPYTNMEFVGLTSLHDPPRLKVKDIIKQIHQAGIKLVRARMLLNAGKNGYNPYFSVLGQFKALQRPLISLQ